MRGRTASLHQVVASDSQNEINWQAFPVGSRVQTSDGLPGTVMGYLDGPMAGGEGYEVTLDGGMGGGAYTPSDLRPLSVRNEPRGHVASEDYPMLSQILVERPPLTHIAPLSSLREAVIHEGTWNEVRAKAVRIRKEGGVRIISAGPAIVVAEVHGDHGIYQPELQFVPGTSQIGLWTCSCPWSAYSWGRSGKWLKYQGRMCSHALATEYEIQSRGMFGREVKEDADTPVWRRGADITHYERPSPNPWMRPTVPRAASRAELHDEPEPALPATTGDEDDDPLAGGGGEAVEDLQSDPFDEPYNMAQEGPVMGSLTASRMPSASTRSWLLDGGSSAKADSADIAKAAKAFIKEGQKTFTRAEQVALINEGQGITASNLDRLDLSGTHYLQEDDDSWLD